MSEKKHNVLRHLILSCLFSLCVMIGCTFAIYFTYQYALNHTVASTYCSPITPTSAVTPDVIPNVTP